MSVFGEHRKQFQVLMREGRSVDDVTWEKSGYYVGEAMCGD